MIFLVFRRCMGQLLTLQGCTTTSLSIDTMAVLGPLLVLGVCLLVSRLVLLVVLMLSIMLSFILGDYTTLTFLARAGSFGLSVFMCRSLVTS